MNEGGNITPDHHRPEEDQAERDQARHAPALARRTLLAGLGALGSTLAAGALFPAAAQTAAPKGAANRRLIDVHHHFTPPAYLEGLGPQHQPAPPSAHWSFDKGLEMMDRDGVAVAIASITTPGFWFGDPALAQRLARVSNDYMAKTVDAHRKRFGFFVAVPLPDVDAALKEIAYGMDQLKADGVGFFTSYGDKWLGDKAFAPVFEELNRRKAVVYVHPTTANCCTGLMPEISDSSIEYGTDTTRAIVQMIYNGSSQRYPDIRMIWSHAGGTMPYLITRFMNDSKNLPKLKEVLPNGFLPEAQRYYYDTAQTYNRATMSGLKEVIPPSHIVFGTDYPYRTAGETLDGVVKSKVFTKQELIGIERDNALTFLPQYRT